MIPVTWLVTIALLYSALGLWLYLLADTVRRRSAAVIIVAVIPVLVVLAGSRLHLGQPASLAITLGVMIAALSTFWLVGARKKCRWQDSKAQMELKRQVKLHLALATGACVFLVPFVWLVSTSFKDDTEINRYPPVWVPTQQVTVKLHSKDCGVSTYKTGKTSYTIAELDELDGGKKRVQVLSPSNMKGSVMVVPAQELVQKRVRGLKWKNYSDALKFLPPEYRSGLVPLWNTILVTLLNIIGTLFSSSLVAYSFARLRWPGREMLFFLLLATMMIPGAVTMLPVFLIFRWLGWVDTLQPLWIGAFFGGAFNVFLLRQFFMTIPGDLEDAAKIDGCSFFMIYWRIMLPLIKPALAAVAIMAFMASWNNFMGPLIYISSPEKMTLAYALQLFQGAHGGERALMMAASTLVMMPVLAVFFFTQRYFIQGVTLTGIKG